MLGDFERTKRLLRFEALLPLKVLWECRIHRLDDRIVNQAVRLDTIRFAMGLTSSRTSGKVPGARTGGQNASFSGGLCPFVGIQMGAKGHG